MSVAKNNTRVRVVVATTVMLSFNAVATLVLRLRRPEGREWKAPGNIRLGRIEIPVGLIIIALVLLSIALTNLLTRQVATISGVAFTAIFFILFTISERINRRQLDLTLSKLDRFQRRVHHRDVVRVALDRLERDLRGQSDVMLDFYKLDKGELKQAGVKTGDGKAGDGGAQKPK